MPLGLGLRGAAALRRVLPFIRSGVNQGLSGRAITRVLQDAGLGIARSTVSSAMRSLLAETLAGQSIELQSPTSFINPEILPPALTKLARKYSFTIRITGTSEQTGFLESRFITVSTDRIMTPEELEAFAEGMGADPRRGYGMIITAVRFIEGRQAGSEGTIL